jgi:hypothetical protein
MGEDQYRFGNTWSSFGYSSNYSIPIERFLEIYKPADAQVYYSALSPWGGNCYGFAASSYAFEDHKLHHADYQNGINQTYNFSVPGTPNNSVTKVIELYQISQFLGVPSREKYSNYNNLSALVANVNNEDGLIVSIRGTGGGHAVIAYGIENLGGTRYSIKIYDNNQPENHDLRIDVDTSKSGKAGWSFNSADTQNYNSNLHDNISFLRGATIYNAVESAKRNKADVSGMQIIVPADAEIVNTAGDKIQDIDGAYEFMPIGVLPLDENGNTPTPFSDTVIWYAPEDNYSVTIEKAEPVTVAVVGDSESYAVNLSPETNNTLTVDIGEVIEIAGATHGNVTEYGDDGSALMLPLMSAPESDTMTVNNTGSADFNDVQDGDWFGDAVASVSSVGIVEGSNHRFNPNGTLTVAELVTMLMRTQYDIPSGNGSKWYAPYIEKAKSDGILHNSDELEPAASVTRAQAALIITRYIERYNPSWAKTRESAVPKDIANTPSEYRSAVEKAYAWKIVQGDDNGNYNPQSTLTRAAAAQILYNYYCIVD